MQRVLGVAGWSGSGKTTLLVELVRRLVADGLAVAVMKHDAHGLDPGDARRDSERLHAAGAAVVAVGPGEGLARWRVADGDAELRWRLRELESRCDLVLVEGWKRAVLPKLWLLRAGETGPSADVPDVVATLGEGADRVALAHALVRRRLDDAWRAAPLRAGVLVGGRSRRMGTPKHALRVDGETLLERAARMLAGIAAVTMLGALPAGGDDASPAGLVALPDAPGVAGPLAGVLAALRWSPQPWLVAACDLPRLAPEAVAWLLAQRAPGRWAVLPRVDDVAQPLLAVYEPQALALLEAIAADGGEPSPARLAGASHVWTPEPPAELAASWRGVNTPEELAVFRQER